jgi:hypothetical protein
VDIEQPDAVASDQAPSAGEEVQEKSFRDCWLPRLARTPVQRLRPGLDRRPLQSGMDRMVVGASDLQRQPALQIQMVKRNENRLGWSRRAWKKRRDTLSTD